MDQQGVMRLPQDIDGIKVDPRSSAETSGVVELVKGMEDDTSNEHPLFEIRLTSNKGFGLFATQDIPRGTRIIIEPALVLVPSSEPAFEHVWKEFQKLTPEQHDQVCDLFVPTTIKPPVSAYVRRELLLSHHYTGVSLIAAVKDELKMRAIFNSNAIAMGPGGHYGRGLFLLASRLNHSCVPNVQQDYNPTLGGSTVHATQNIKEGEEITRSYIQHVRNDRKLRDDLLSFWDFECDCVACQGPEAALRERRRRRTLEHVAGLAMYDMGVGSSGAPSGPGQALAWAEEMVVLLKQQGLEDLELKLAYRKCSGYCVELGHLEKAMAYARKELAVQRYCLGTETAHMEMDMEGAEFWIKHLEQVAEKDRVRIAMNRKRAKKEDKRVEKKAVKKAARALPQAVELRRTPDKGYGLFATKFIAPQALALYYKTSLLDPKVFAIVSRNSPVDPPSQLTQADVEEQLKGFAIFKMNSVAMGGHANYGDCSRHSLTFMDEDLEKAIAYAEKEREIAVACIGMDMAMEGSAKDWLATLRSQVSEKREARERHLREEQEMAAYGEDEKAWEAAKKNTKKNHRVLHAAAKIIDAEQQEAESLIEALSPVELEILAAKLGGKVDALELKAIFQEKIKCMYDDCRVERDEFLSFE
ncbi:hypothetical protein LTR08_002638 [Meristemomyces frigidus]|nr:hypothetical protein LTR08_002638 [Meristemomyces frigidus]